MFECLFLCLPPAVFAAGGGIRELAAAILAGKVLSAAAYFLLMRGKGMLRGILSAPAGLLGELSGYAGWVTLARASMIGAEESGRFIAGALCGISGLVLYNVPHEIYTSLAIIPSCFLAALFPAFSAACAREGMARLGAYFYGYAAKLFLLTALAFSGLIIFAPEILFILTGAEQPAAAVRILQLLAFAEMAAGTNYVGMGWFNGLNRPGVPARIHAGSLALFLPVCWAAVKYMGAAGAAAAMVFKILLENALYITLAGKAGAGSGRKTFIAAAAGGFALAACAALLSRALPMASFYKTAFFLAALAGTAALLYAGFFTGAAPLPATGRRQSVSL